MTTTKEMNEFIQTLRREFPSYAALKYPVPVELRDLPLREGEVVLEYKVGDDATYLWALVKGPSGPSIEGFYKLPVGSVELRKLVDDFRRPLSEVLTTEFKYESSHKLFALCYPRWEKRSFIVSTASS